MTGFCIQEFIISGIYIWKTLDILTTGQRKHTHRIMAQLFVVNLIIVALDVGLLVLEYLNLFIAEVSFKELSYSVKLKLEFAILSKLVEFTSTGQRRFSNFFGDTTGFIDKEGRSQSFATAQRIPSSPTLRSDGRPQWMHEVERAQTLDLPEQAAISESKDVSAASGEGSKDHNFDSDSGPSKRRLQCLSDPDLMYADALRTITKD